MAFHVNKDVCLISKHITNALTSGMKESQSEFEDDEPTPEEKDEDAANEPTDGIKLKIEAEILEICIKFMHYKFINRQVTFTRPEFPIHPDKALQVLEAAIYLEC